MDLQPGLDDFAWSGSRSRMREWSTREPHQPSIEIVRTSTMRSNASRCAAGIGRTDGGIGVDAGLIFVNSKGMRDDYIVLVGGAPLNEEFGKAVGADASCRDAAVAVETAKNLIARKHNQLGARATTA